MSAWVNRNVVKVLKEQTASPATVAVPGDDEGRSDAPRRLVSVEPKKVSLPALAESAPAPKPVTTAKPAAVPEVVYTSIGPVSMPQALAKLVMPSEFRFEGVVKSPEPSITLQPAETRQPVDAVRTPAAAPKPVAIAPPIPVAATPTPTVTSSSDLYHPPQRQPHAQRSPPQSVYTPQVDNNMSQFEGGWPHGGELGSVPRYYSSQPQYNAQPFYPSYQTPHFPGGYTSNALQYGGFRSTYHGYYHSPGVQYMGSRLQPCAPYYPPPDQSQQQHPAAQYN
ncbi:hypothetical protein JKF63_06029 [Porcisia hertigi]|uniref:Uncharacterized protein n=1 Tax=Porcisia hertigi TaxID=2761500 RepID=A0A836LBV7_9TRYP|nr:hypothetical protein JKF63_06029 [Porcisia hertigi]